MTPLKINRAFGIAGISMPSVRAHIERNMSALREQLGGLTSAQLAAVIDLHNTAYHQGRASTGAECLDGNPADGLYWLGGKDGIAVTMLRGAPVPSSDPNRGLEALVTLPDG